MQMNFDYMFPRRRPQNHSIAAGAAKEPPESRERFDCKSGGAAAGFCEEFFRLEPLVCFLFRRFLL